MIELFPQKQIARVLMDQINNHMGFTWLTFEFGDFGAFVSINLLTNERSAD
jgi:hypothetical protein